MRTTPIRVLVVDDSALARKVITSSLAPFRDIEVVATAMDPYVARDKILELNPDVITLDIEMPRMDGLTFLKLIMKFKPRPVIIMSSRTTAGSHMAFEALQAGAFEVIEKPDGAFSAHSDGTMLANKIRAAAGARLRPVAERKEPERPVAARRIATAKSGLNPRSLILLGASTGGTEALKTVLCSMGADLPCICLVQHIPASFSRAFAERLNQLCQFEVREAVEGDKTRPGLALVAPGGYHIVLNWQATHYTVRLCQGPPVHHQCPAVDILFDSAVKAGASPHSVAALLTGMGADGARGLLHLAQAGAFTIAQDEASSVVFGMPREAIALGAAREVLPLGRIGRRLEEFVNTKPSSCHEPSPAYAA